jgi:PhnB protein
MATVNIYLTFNGNCETAFTFYKSVFGGDFNYIGRFKDMPSAAGCAEVAEADREKIMHVGLPVSKETMLMGSDCDSNTNFVQGNNFSICVTPDSVEDAGRIFNALAVGGKIIMPLEKQFWGSLNGMLVDKFGINWMVDMALEQ